MLRTARHRLGLPPEYPYPARVKFALLDAPYSSFPSRTMTPHLASSRLCPLIPLLRSRSAWSNPPRLSPVKFPPWLPAHTSHTGIHLTPSTTANTRSSCVPASTILMDGTAYPAPGSTASNGGRPLDVPFGNPHGGGPAFLARSRWNSAMSLPTAPASVAAPWRSPRRSTVRYTKPPMFATSLRWLRKVWYRQPGRNGPPVLLTVGELSCAPGTR